MGGFLFLFYDKSDCLSARRSGIKGFSAMARLGFDTESAVHNR